MSKTIIGVDIGGTYFRIGTVEEDGKVSDFRKLPVERVVRPGHPMEELGAFLNDYCSGKDPEAVCIGFPATLDASRETVLQAPNLPFLENLPVAAVLSRELKIPVFIERDVVMTFAYDCGIRNIPDFGIACGFYFGTGIGNAISVNGLPLTGKHGTAGELGHIPVDGSKVVCGCGNKGCMEPLAGGRYLKHLQETVYTDTPIADLFTRHGQQPLLRQFVDRMAMTVATEINILDPEHILIGGGVAAMADFPREYLLERIRFHTRKPLPADDMQIVFTGDAEEKTVLGAAHYARRMLRRRKSGK